MNCLFVTSEAYPLIKTGGLADVSGSLPRALLQLHQDVRILMPAYQSVMQQLERARVIGSTFHYDYHINILQARLPGTRVQVMLVDCPAAFERPGNPYVDDSGEPWADNAFRFAVFSQVAVDVALNRLAFDWPVDIVHCNDWQSGLVPALLSLFEQRPATLFTIHNLAYQGLFDKQAYIDLGLPAELWHMHGVEYHDLFSFIKGGLSYADCVSTVSPQYAIEIQSPELGYGLADLLKYRSDSLFGILNGIDTEVWNPGADNYLVHHYNRRSMSGKDLNKQGLQQHFGLTVDQGLPMIGMISRLVEQKGLDIILQAMPKLVELPLQWVFLGSGQVEYETGLVELSRQYPDRIAVTIGYDEQLSHRIEAASDCYLMPSMFEPCGLNQLYSLRYGTIPIVTRVGGLADSVIDYSSSKDNRFSATGFVMADFTAAALVKAVQRMLAAYQQDDLWKKIQQNAMSQDHSWKHSAASYVELYQRAVDYNR